MSCGILCRVGDCRNYAQYVVRTPAGINSFACSLCSLGFTRVDEISATLHRSAEGMKSLADQKAIRIEQAPPPPPVVWLIERWEQPIHSSGKWITVREVTAPTGAEAARIAFPPAGSVPRGYRIRQKPVTASTGEAI